MKREEFYKNLNFVATFLTGGSFLLIKPKQNMTNTVKLITVGISALLVTSVSAEREGKERGERGERPSLDEVFTKLDANEDGFLSYDEFQLPPKKEASEEQKQARLDKIDADADGQLSQEEFTSQKRSKRGGGKRGEREEG